MSINLFALPDSITTSILSDWITTRMLFVLDSAVCNVKIRDKFSRLITYKSFVSYGLDPRESFKLIQYFTGLKKRSIKIKNLTIDSFQMKHLEYTVIAMRDLKNALGDHNCGLLNLDISRCYVNNDILFALSQMFKSLLSINMNKCIFSDTTFIFDVMGDCFPQLQSLHLSHCMKLNFNRMALLLRGCRDMRSLDISFCSEIRDDSILQIIEVIGHQLEYLNIEGCSSAIKKESIQKLVQCPMLRYLRTSAFEVHISIPYYSEEYYVPVSSVEDAQMTRKVYELHVFAALMEVVQLFPHVNTLVLANKGGKFCELKSTLIKLMDKAHRLHTLDITSYGISMNELHEVIDVYPKLKHLRVHFCKGLTYSAALDLMRKYTPSKILSLRTPDLEYNVTDGKLVLKFNLLSNELFSDLLLCFPQLHTLELYNSELLTEDVLDLVASQCAPTLHSLSLIFCREFSNAAILRLLRECKGLKALTLCKNRNCFTEDTLLEVLSIVPGLEWITCGEITGLSDATIAKVREICPLIRIYV